MELDVTDRAAAFAAVRSAHDGFGRVDVVRGRFGHQGDAERANRLLHRLARFVSPSCGALAAYDEMHEETKRMRASRSADPGEPSDPSDPSDPRCDLATCRRPEPTLRIFFGDGTLALATRDYRVKVGAEVK